MDAKFDISSYDEHFNETSQGIRAGPVPNEKRSCNDLCCVVTFVLIILATLIIGAIMISDGKPYF